MKPQKLPANLDEVIHCPSWSIFSEENCLSCCCMRSMQYEGRPPHSEKMKISNNTGNSGEIKGIFSFSEGVFVTGNFCMEKFMALKKYKIGLLMLKKKKSSDLHKECFSLNFLEFCGIVMNS